MERQLIYDYIANQYDIFPEFPWIKYPDYAVFRHENNKKWFALIMTVKKNKIGLEGEEPVEILNVKCDPLMIDFMRQTPGFLPAYHMSKKCWMSILLDGTVALKEIQSFINTSYNLTY